LNISTHGDERKIQLVAKERKALNETMEVFQTLVIVDPADQEHHRQVVQTCASVLLKFGTVKQ
jgi:hypothetical protein